LTKNLIHENSNAKVFINFQKTDCMVKKQQDTIDIFAVSRMAKVSPATVSRVFNHPHLVRPNTRSAVDLAVEKLGYVRNRKPKSVGGKRSGTIGVIVPTVTNAIFAEVIQAFSDVVKQSGFSTLIAIHDYDLNQELDILRKFLELQVDGIALIGLQHLKATYKTIEQRAIPAISIWNYDPASEISCVGTDNYEAGYLATKHLIDLGHKEIGIAFPPTDDNDRARKRLQGARTALSGAGMEPADQWTVQSVYEITKAKNACLDLLSIDKIPSAIVCGNDIIAQGASFACQRLGLSVPDDLSIVGIGDFTGSADMEPPLSTVRIPARRIGQQAGHHLAITILENKPTEILRSQLGVEMIVRGTTAPYVAA
jgi:LacI family transcriptional regulator